MLALRFDCVPPAVASVVRSGQILWSIIFVIAIEMMNSYRLESDVSLAMEALVRSWTVVREEYFSMSATSARVHLVGGRLSLHCQWSLTHKNMLQIDVRTTVKPRPAPAMADILTGGDQYGSTAVDMQ
jgi:hypothetical protein